MSEPVSVATYGSGHGQIGKAGIRISSLEAGGWAGTFPTLCLEAGAGNQTKESADENSMVMQTYVLFLHRKVRRRSGGCRLS